MKQNLAFDPEFEAPEVVLYDYYMVGNTHVRTTRSLPGLVHVGSSDEDTVDQRFFDSVNFLATTMYGGGKRYRYVEDGVMQLVLVH